MSAAEFWRLQDLRFSRTIPLLPSISNLIQVLFSYASLAELTIMRMAWILAPMCAAAVVNRSGMVILIQRHKSQFINEIWFLGIVEGKNLRLFLLQLAYHQVPEVYWDGLHWLDMYNPYRYDTSNVLQFFGAGVTISSRSVGYNAPMVAIAI